MKHFRIYYTGFSTRYKNLSEVVEGQDPKELLERFYQSILDENYFPEEDGTIKDMDGEVIREPDDTDIFYDGGYFMIEEITYQDEELELLEVVEEVNYWYHGEYKKVPFSLYYNEGVGTEISWIKGRPNEMTEGVEEQIINHLIK